MDNALSRRLDAADLAAFQWANRRESPTVDRALVRLTRSADHGVLWYAAAAALAATGPRGRRAAVRGLLGMSLASAVANLPAKFAVRRRRPPLTSVPVSRRLGRQPSTLSFPSGHSASAAAFATGVGLEWPALAAPVGALAAGVAWSRVHTGVHYPGDVLAGVALGASASLLLTRPWPHAQARPEPETPADASAPARPDGRGVVVVMNPGAGSDEGDDLAGLIRGRLPRAEVVEAGEDMLATLREAAQRADVLGVCGGDGSINAAAQVAMATGHPLLVLPGGTLNHFSCDLGIADVEDALDAIAEGTASAVDVGETDDGLFLNTASIGGYPQMVALRERLEDNIGKWPAAVIALVRTLRTGEPMDVEVDGRRLAAWLVFVGNGCHQPRGVAVTSRPRLDDGLLDVRVVEARRWARVRLVGAALAGRLHRSPAFHAFSCEKLTVRLLDGARPLARDGEVGDEVETVEFRKRRRALTVYRPPLPAKS